MLRALTLSLALAGPASAQTCAHTEEIIGASWAALAARPEIGGFGGTRAGLDAAYLLLRYGDQNPTVTEAVFAALETGRRPHPQLDDLRLTYEIWRDGLDVALAKLDDPVRAVLGGFWSVRRAVILADGGETYLRLMGEGAARDDLEGYQTLEQMWAPIAAGVVMDQPDAMKAAFAERAIAAGYPLLAGLLLADMSDPSGFYAHFETLTPEQAEFLRHPTHYGLALFSGQGRLWPHDGEGVDSHRALRSALYLNPADYLMITLNQTGEVEGVMRVVDRLGAVVAEGQFDPLTDMDQAWLFAFDALIEEIGPDKTLIALGGFDMPSLRVRHYTGPFALGTLTDMAAIRALAPYAAGEGEALPAAHPFLSYPDVWVTAAETLRNRGVIQPEFQAEAAELLFVAGDIENAVNVARNIADPDRREAVLTDFIKRMDRRCEAATFFPMQGLILGGDLMWDFPQ